MRTHLCSCLLYLDRHIQVEERVLYVFLSRVQFRVVLLCNLSLLFRLRDYPRRGKFAQFSLLFQSFRCKVGVKAFICT